MRNALLMMTCTMAAALIALPLASDAATKRPKKAPAGQEAVEGPVYETTGPSTYCLEHPSQCKDKHPEDRAVNAPYENCVDVYGNGDGFVSQWELNSFGPRCR